MLRGSGPVRGFVCAVSAKEHQDFPIVQSIAALPISPQRAL